MYKILQDNCTLTATSICQILGPGSLQDSEYGILRIYSVVGAKVDFTIVSVYTNGTSSRDAVSADVLSGTTNATTLGGAGSKDYFVLAASLTKGDPIWGSGEASTPRINSSSTETIIGGTPRDVNFLNLTVSNSAYGSTLTGSSGFAYDKTSGLFVEISVSLTASGLVHGDFDLTMVMVDNNIWLSSTPPDYTLSASPTNLNIAGTATGSTTITPTRSNKFSATIVLKETPSSNSLTCSLSRTRLNAGGSDSSNLSCKGSPGSYSVTVEGDGSYTIHTVTITVSIVPAAPVSPQAAGPLPIMLIALGGVAAPVFAILALLLLRRRPRASAVTQSNAHRSSDSGLAQIP